MKKPGPRLVTVKITARTAAWVRSNILMLLLHRLSRLVALSAVGGSQFDGPLTLPRRAHPPRDVSADPAYSSWTARYSDWPLTKPGKFKIRDSELRRSGSGDVRF
jgi:hypothetical protein